VVTKLLVISILSPGDYFGEGSILANSKRQALSEVFKPTKLERGVSVITNMKTECLVLSKVDYLRFASDRTFDILRAENAAKQIPDLSIVESFTTCNAWLTYKKKIMKEIMDTIGSNRLKKNSLNVTHY
jgi:hypothetical protein